MIDWPIATVILGVIAAVGKLIHDWTMSTKLTRVETLQHSEKGVSEERVSTLASHFEATQKQNDARLERAERNTDARIDRMETRTARIEKQIDGILDALVELAK